MAKGTYTRKRVDQNHKEVVRALDAIGCSVLSLADKGHGCPDLLVGYRGSNYLIEVKNGRGELTDDQVKFFSKWKGQISVIRGIDGVLNFLNSLGNN